MLLSDLILLAALTGFCIAWLWTGSAWRDAALWATVSAALVSGAWGVLDGRWQAGLGTAVAVVFLVTLAVRMRREQVIEGRRPLVSGIAFVVLAVLSFGLLYSVPVFSLPEPDGPYDVGVRDFELTDTERTGVLYASPDEPRRLAVRVWYPAAATAGFERRPYATAAELETTFPAVATQELGAPSFFYSHLRHIDTHSFVDAPVVDEGPLPVVFFHHGLNGHLSQNTVLMEHLAGHGYVVFSISHPYDAAPVVFDDGDVIALPDSEVAAREGRAEYPDAALALVDQLGGREDGRTYDERFDGTLGLIQLARVVDDRVFDTSPQVWVEDTLFVERELVEGRAPISDILAVSDLSQVGQVGMSFGGSTAAALGYLDPRSAAVVNLDGSDYHQVGYDADVPVALLMLYTDSLDTLGSVEDVPYGWNDFLFERFETAGTRDDVVRLHLAGVQHLGATDAQLMTRGPLHTVLAGSLGSDRALDAMNDVVLAFFDEHLRHTSVGFPGAQLEAHSGDLELHDVAPIREWWNAKSPSQQAEARQALDEALDNGVPIRIRSARPRG